MCWRNSPELLRAAGWMCSPAFPSCTSSSAAARAASPAAWPRPTRACFSPPWRKVPDALVVAMERACGQSLGNIRFLAQDAADLGDYFAPGEVSRIYINFPDPRPKKRQFKRRLTAPSFQKLCFDALAPGGEIWFKTDNQPLFEWSLEQYAACGWQLREVTRDLHAGTPDAVMTDYEAKFREQGVKINRLVAVKGAAFIEPRGEEA